jgi:hypothetical protein
MLNQRRGAVLYWSTDPQVAVPSGGVNRHAKSPELFWPMLKQVSE